METVDESGQLSSVFRMDRSAHRVVEQTEQDNAEQGEEDGSQRLRSVAGREVEAWRRYQSA